MPNIQILEIILYPKEPENKKIKKKIVKFKTGALNIVYGASQTGKSAIIPIIDYCLGAKDNKIPVGVIRNNCQGFGLKLKVDDKELFLARSIEEGKSSQISYLMDGTINTNKLKKEDMQVYSLEKLKIHLNDLFGISFLNTEHITGKSPDDAEKDRKDDRPSYRDLVCFNFQSQNIVANPNCLLYKSDIYYHRQKIKKIFNYAIGAQTSEQLEGEYLKEQLLKDLADLNYKKNKENAYRNQIISDSELIIYKAMEAGLIPNKEFNLKDHIAIEDLLKEIAKKELSDISFSEVGGQPAIEKIKSTIMKLDELNCELRGLKQERNDIDEIIGLVGKQNNQLTIKKERLEISKFIKEFCEINKKDSSVLNDIENLCNNLELVENQLIIKNIDRQSGVFHSKLAVIKDKIYQKQKEINQNNKIKEILEHEKINKTILEDIYVDVIGEAKKYLKYLANNNDLTSDIDDLEKNIESLDFNVEENQRKELQSIINKANNYLAEFAEFDKLYYFSDKDLTVKVKNNKENESFYLWETGSGSNWVAYHIATLLGFHSHFIKKDLPAFNFLIFDQPSQVYFPNQNKKYDDTIDYAKTKKKKNNKILKSDFECVRDIFKIMSRAIIDHKPSKEIIQKTENGENIVIREELESKLQIIVLDHAGEDIWNGVDDIKDVYALKEWTIDNRLVPKDWIKNNISSV